MAKHMEGSKAEEVRRGICVILENLQCPICLDLMSAPISTKCDHQFCRFCIMKLLDNTKRREASCPVCKAKVTKRSLQDSPGFMRLVEGVKNLMQAFEEDCCVSHIREASEKVESPCATMRGCEEVQLEGRTTSGSKPNKSTVGNSQSQGSDDATSPSTKAKKGFARIMGLEDSCAFTSEGEDLESRASDGQQTSQGRSDKNGKSSPSGAETHVPCRKSEKNVLAHKSEKRRDDASFQNGQVSDAKISKKERLTHLKGGENVSSGEDGVVDKRQKKNLEKVSEWLLNHTVGDGGDSDLSASSQDHYEDCCSDGNSISFTEESKDEHQTRNPKRSNHSLCLEEKVFGVIYKKSRRSPAAQVNSRFSPRVKEVSHLAACSLSEKTQKTVARKRWNSRLSPADFIMRPHTELEDCHTVKEKSTTEDCTISEKLIDGEAAKDIDCINISKAADGKVILGCESSVENEELKDGSDFEVPLQRPTTTNKSKMQGTSQETADNLEKEAMENIKENDASNGRKCLSDKKRNALAGKRLVKSTEALDLVSVPMGNPDSGTKPTRGILLEAEVPIDSYPHAEDRGAPVHKTLRQSKRLKGSRKRASSNRSTKSVISDFENGVGVYETARGVTQMENTFKRNGCVAFVDVPGIEKDESFIDEDMKGECEQKQYETEKDSSLAVHNVQTLPITLESSVIKTDQPQCPNSRKDGSNAGVEVPFSTSAVTNSEVKEDRNDSELDTEQLLKTFKATKRRSFYIGSPNNKCSDRDSFNSGRLHRSEVQSPKVELKEEKLNKRTPELLCIADSAELVEQDTETLALGLENRSVSTKTESFHSTDVIPSTDSFNPAAHKALSPKSGAVGCQRRSDVTLNISTCKSTDSGEWLSLNAWENNHSCSGSGSAGTVKPNRVKSPSRIQKETTSANSLNREEVGSELLFTSGEEELENPSGKITEKLPPVLAECTNPGDPSEDANDGACNVKVSSEPLTRGSNNLLTSSVTPDDLLPPNIVVAASSKSAASSIESCNPITPLKKRRRSQRLESSESEDSSDDVQLPSLAELFGHATSCKEIPPLQDQESAEVPSRGEPVPSKVAGKCLSPYSDPEEVPASQGSVDLFGTPEECEGGPGVSGFSGESSQLSSQIIGTQQKLALQEELHRLERMMVLVTEALQQKEDSCEQGPPPESSSVSAAGACLHSTQLCDSQKRASISRPMRSPLPAQAPTSPDQKRNVHYLETSTHPNPVALEAKLDEGHGVAVDGQDDGSTGGPCQAVGETRGCSTGMPTRTSGMEGAPRCEFPLPSLRPQSTFPVQLGCSRIRHGKMVLVASGLSAAELSVVKKFATKVGGSVHPEVTSETTHVVIRTDGELVCERTLKYFLGIAGRKWVVSFQWIMECFRQGRVLHEAPFEVRGDTANGTNHQGPKRARTTDDLQLLMRNIEVCFQGSFTNMAAGQMEWMVELCGATVVKDPILFAPECRSKLQLVVVPGDSHMDYKGLQQRAIVVPRGWLLDSVATYTLQNPDDYKL